MDDCLEFESDPEIVVAARRFVRDRLQAWGAGDLADGATLIASELVTNAVLHARTAARLHLQMGGPTLRIEVFDENPRLPLVGPCRTDATSGRGLALVASLATAWGMENRADGKVVWAEMGPPADSEAGPDDCVDLAGVDSAEEAVEEVRRARPA